MGKRNTRRQRQRRRKAPRPLAEADKAIQETQARALRLFERRLETAKRTHCPSCAWNMVCLAQRYPDDLEYCTNCDSLYSPSANVRVHCQNVIEETLVEEIYWRMLLTCARCTGEGLGARDDTLIIHGFNVPKPGIVSTAQLQKRFGERK